MYFRAVSMTQVEEHLPRQVQGPEFKHNHTHPHRMYFKEEKMEVEPTDIEET
jgi:hypothetical protein